MNTLFNASMKVKKSPLYITWKSWLKLWYFATVLTISYILSCSSMLYASEKNIFNLSIPHSRLDDKGQSRQAIMGDINKDGYLDIYVTNHLDWQNKLRINNKNQGFVDKSISGDLWNSLGAAIGDVNNDGHLDIYVANANNQQNKLRINNGDGSFELNHIQYDLGYSYDAIMGDVNNDGHLDIYVANANNQQNKLRINNGSGAFDAWELPANTNSSIGAVMGDIDNDGDLDIYVANAYNQHNKLLINNGSGVFVEENIDNNDKWNSRIPIMGDIDNDGDLDIYVTNHVHDSFGNQNKLRINNGDGSFESKDIHNDMWNSLGAVMGDIDNDGDLDIYVANYDNQQNKLRINNGDGSFESKDIQNDMSNSLGAVMGDIDNDGYIDIYVANYDNQQNKLRINQNEPERARWSYQPSSVAPEGETEYQRNRRLRIINNPPIPDISTPTPRYVTSIRTDNPLYGRQPPHQEIQYHGTTSIADIVIRRPQQEENQRPLTGDPRLRESHRLLSSLSTQMQEYVRTCSDPSDTMARFDCLFGTVGPAMLIDGPVAPTRVNSLYAQRLAHATQRYDRYDQQIALMRRMMQQLSVMQDFAQRAYGIDTRDFVTLTSGVYQAMEEM